MNIAVTTTALKKGHFSQLNSKHVLYVQEVVTQPKILNRTILTNPIHVT